MIKQITRNIKKWSLASQTRRELEQLTDRELCDLGISRSDIRAIARNQASIY